METNDTTFYVYQDEASVFHVVETMGEVPSAHRELSRAVEVSADEAAILRSASEEGDTDVVQEIRMLTGVSIDAIDEITSPPGIDYGLIGLGLGLVAALIVCRNIAKSAGHRLLSHIITSFIFSAITAVGYTAIKQYKATQPVPASEAQKAPANELEKKGQEAIQRLELRHGKQRKVLDSIKGQKHQRR